MTVSVPSQGEVAALASQPMLTCAHLRKSFGDLRAVDDVSFEIAAGETYGLLGPNGAGKTTIISMVAGVLDADQGDVLVQGRTMHPGALEVKARIGYVPQDIAVYPDLSGRENVRFFASLYRLRGRRAKVRASEVLDVVGLGERADDRVKEYSGGMKRRLNIALGLLHRPSLLILDEPTVGVDPQSRNSILDSIESLSQEGMAVLYTTHYMEEAERLCDRVGIVDGGHLVAEGTPASLRATLGAAQHIVLTVDGGSEGADGGVDGVATSIASLPLVTSCTPSDHGLDVLVRSAEQALPAVMQAATASGAVIRSVTVQEPDLEAVFLRLTGKRLRD